MRRIRDFARDERGIALILVSIMLPVMIGFALLAIDISRANTMHQSLQKATDALALATAAELDGRPNAITRADRALTTLLTGTTGNVYKFSNDGNAPVLDGSGVTHIYLKDLPTSDATRIDPVTGIDELGVAHKTTDPTLAQFVLVKADPVDFSAIFPVSFLNAASSGDITMSTTAVAGFKSAVCDFTPMFMCNPFKASGGKTGLQRLQDSVDPSHHDRPMIMLKKQKGGNGAQYFPGNYGFLKTPDDKSTPKALAEMFASTGPKQCYGNDGVETKTGNMPTIDDGFNVRFDIYGKGSANGVNNPGLYPPAPNVRKGMVVKNAGKPSCTYNAPTVAQQPSYKGLPRDTCFGSPTGCTVLDTVNSGIARLGDGAWDRSGYWLVNHNAGWPAQAINGDTLDANASRYETYKFEFKHKAALASGLESTDPQCNTTTQDEKRRLIYVAILDCENTVVKGGQGSYKPLTFASIFLTEPAGDPPDADIYGELVDLANMQGQHTMDKFVRNEPQLYR